MRTPIGPLFVSANERALVSLSFEETTSSRTSITDQIEHELDLYFQGKLQSFQTPFELNGTPFQISVWKALLTIPYGQTISYSELAQNIGKPTAFRAVAQANRANRIPILIPCHRVINSNGNLGGYNCGLHRKRHLLALEQQSI